MENSNFLSLNWKDIVKAGFMLGLGMLLTFLYGVATNGELPTITQFLAELKIVGFAVAIYIIKQILSGTTGMPFTKGDS